MHEVRGLWRLKSDLAVSFGKLSFGPNRAKRCQIFPTIDIFHVFVKTAHLESIPNWHKNRHFQCFLRNGLFLFFYFFPFCMKLENYKGVSGNFSFGPNRAKISRKIDIFNVLSEAADFFSDFVFSFLSRLHYKRKVSVNSAKKVSVNIQIFRTIISRYFGWIKFPTNKTFTLRRYVSWVG